MNDKFLTLSLSIVVWLIGCAIADFVLELDASAWRMLFGFFVGWVAFVWVPAELAKRPLDKRLEVKS